MSWQADYIHKYYERLPGWKDLQAQWHELLKMHVPPNARVLEVGAGPFNDTSQYLAELSGHLVGLDIDPDVRENPCLDEVHVYDGGKFPFPDGHFDVVVSRWVNEHLEDPEAHCAEINRVLAPGGKYIFRTPNLYHYSAFIASITPHWFHLLVANRLRNYSSAHHDPYPTYYRFNTRRRCHSLLNRQSFEVEALDVKETFPVYGQASRLMFYLFMAYERVVNATSWLEGFRYTIDCVARKKAQVAVEAGRR
ncbi:MAG: class I SAM-dependent methyltransferase [Anaerolineae bacterium]